MNKNEKKKIKKERAIDKLNDRQKLFVVEYVKDLNATQAYIRAGYTCNEETARANSSRMLTNANIQNAINEIIDEVMGDRKEISFKIINELKLVAFADIGNYLEYDENGIVKIIPSSRVDTRPIVKVKQNTSKKTVKEGDTIETSQFEFNLADKLKALELLAKYAKLFDDKSDISIENNGEIIIVAAKGTEDW